MLTIYPLSIQRLDIQKGPQMAQSLDCLSDERHPGIASVVVVVTRFGSRTKSEFLFELRDRDGT